MNQGKDYSRNYASLGQKKYKRVVKRKEKHENGKRKKEKK